MHGVAGALLPDFSGLGYPSTQRPRSLFLFTVSLYHIARAVRGRLTGRASMNPAPGTLQKQETITKVWEAFCENENHE